MKKSDYQIRLKPQTLPADTWQGVLNVRAWWAQDTEGKPKQEDDHFTVRFGTTYGTFKVSELTTDRMVWEVTDSYLDLLANPQEWAGTRLIFQLPVNQDQPMIDVTHEGLTPEKECFNDCQQGWNFFLGESLLRYLDTGKGLPAIGIHAWLQLKGQVYRGKLYSPEQTPESQNKPMILLDVKANKVEEIRRIYDFRVYDGQPGQLKGKYYALLPDEPGLTEKLQGLMT